MQRFDSVWFHVVGSCSKWLHPYVAFSYEKEVFLAEIWRFPIGWAKLNPSLLFEKDHFAWVNTGTTFHSKELEGKKDLLHSVAIWILETYEKQGLVSRKSTMSHCVEQNGLFRMDKVVCPASPHGRFNFPEQDVEMETQKSLIQNWFVHPSDVIITSADVLTGRELEEMHARLLFEIKAKTPPGVWKNTRCSHCWKDGEMLRCDDCQRFSCCVTCHSLLKPLIPEQEVVCVQCIFEEQAEESFRVQNLREKVDLLL